MDDSVGETPLMEDFSTLFYDDNDGDDGSVDTDDDDVRTSDNNKRATTFAARAPKKALDMSLSSPSLPRKHTASRVAAARLSPDVRSTLRADGERRMELADRAQQTYFLAYELECEMADLVLWTEAVIIPQSWRVAIRQHLAPLLRRMKRHLAGLIDAESLLLPPFDPRTLAQYDAQLQVTEDMTLFVYDAIQDCKARALKGERTVAAAMIQLHVRRRLRQKGFYTTKVKLTKLQRGLIPGLFDGIKGETIMNITPECITLEYPKTIDVPTTNS
ncbi:Aste57867_14754 [Aphanomyces stellatus]|uniref:Aste57867_14754 protein n=1 Tax=Aphanomyces stellatus TaxID=120398 RepID=A0A485L1H5_9STRA|nr:hypothetical protein As57867_014699 [Aphanomyces stellatus]VFT91572.1 Aste57867_14754 [Aphanomyces stellatus]